MFRWEEGASQTARQKADKEEGCTEHLVIEERLILNRANLAFKRGWEGHPGGEWVLAYLRGWLRGLLGVLWG